MEWPVFTCIAPSTCILRVLTRKRIEYAANIQTDKIKHEHKNGPTLEIIR